MGYSVSLVQRETEAAYKAAGSPDFFENEDNLIPFKAASTRQLIKALTPRGFVEGKKSKRGRTFACDAWGPRRCSPTGPSTSPREATESSRS